MCCNRRNQATGRRSKLVVILLMFLLPLLSGCAQGQLEQLVSDIKDFYLKGGFSNVAETADNVLAPGTGALDKPGGASAEPVKPSSSSTEEKPPMGESL